MIYHPRMVNPSASITDINPVHYSVLESDPLLIEKITSLLSQNGTGSIHYSGQRKSTEDREQLFTSTDTKTEMSDTRCKTVSPEGVNFELVLCITQSGDV